MNAKRWIVPLSLTLATGLALSWLFGSLVIGRHTVPQHPLPDGAQLVHLSSSDGIRLSGNFWPGSDDHSPAILMLHGLGSSRSQFDTDGAAFADRGYAVLAINLRAHGDSGGDQRSFGFFEARDAHSAFTWLKTHQNGAKTGVIGMSLGGAAALLGPEGPLPADALVLTVVYPDLKHAIRNRIASRIGSLLGAIGEPVLSYQAPLRFGVWPDQLSPIEAIKRFHAPVFIIGGESDLYTPPGETKALFANASAPKQLWIVQNADHNGTSTNPRYLPRVEAFMDAALR